MSDGVQQAVTIGQFILSALITVGLAWTAHRQRQLEKAQDALQAQQDRNIEMRFQALQREIVLQLQPIQVRLEKGDEFFDKLEERAQKANLAFTNALAQAREFYAREHVTRGECAEHRRETASRLTSLENRLTHVETRS
jgi:hypothetical protein